MFVALRIFFYRTECVTAGDVSDKKQITKLILLSF
jgi:hypothetical protein